MTKKTTKAAEEKPEQIPKDVFDIIIKTLLKTPPELKKKAVSK